MMRAFLDRLLFALPTPSRASLVRGGLYLLFGLLLYGLFLSALHVQDLGVVRLRQWCGRLPGVRVDMSQPRLSFFPPALAIDTLTVWPRDGGPLAFRNIRAALTAFPFGVSLDAGVAGGGLSVTVVPSALWNPDRLDAHATLNGAGIEPLFRPFANKKGGLVRTLSGTLDGSATLELPMRNNRPVPAESGGTLQLALHGGTTDLSLPMLKAPRLDKLDGTLETGWKKDRLSLHRLELRSPAIACSVQGQVTLSPRDLPASVMDMQAVLRIPLDALRQESVPERTLQSFKDTGEVRLRLRDAFRRPSIDVQP